MAVNLVVGVTDPDWFQYFRSRPLLDEINFWAPGTANFHALSPGELWLFKLKRTNFIVGAGVFAKASKMPCSLAWQAFGEANGAPDFRSFRDRIARLKHIDPNITEDFVIGCRILTQPFFLDKIEWIAVPPSWSNQIVSFKTYSTDEPDGMALWQAVQHRLQASATFLQEVEQERYGNPMLVRPRLGQGAFRLIVTDNYKRRCAVTGERTLPALEAAHIKPYAEGGTHEPSNGLLFRRDLHSLFDLGYVTVTPDLHFEVSPRIREEFENGRDYYRLHGSLVATPDDPRAKPDLSALRWHNDHRFQRPTK